MNADCAFDTGAYLYANPFVVESPEKLLPQAIVDLFVEKHTKLEVIRQRKHTFIWGSRGSGKSMMLRYLEPRCQAIVHKSMAEFFNSSEAFLAIYCPCKEGRFNKSEFLLLDSVASSVLTEHLINLSIADRLLSCLKGQFPADFLDKAECIDFARAVHRLFDPTSIASSVEEATAVTPVESDPLGWLQLLFTAEQRKVNSYLRRIALTASDVTYEGTTSGYHDFLLPFLGRVQRMSRLSSVPVYVMLDDADRLRETQQRIINTWVANRDQSVLCLKISAQPAGYQTFLTRDGGRIEEAHDYSQIDADELYTQSKSDYAQKVRLIAERRLTLSPLQTKRIDEFLPADPGEAALFESIKQQTRKEWTEVGRPGRQHDYVYRYATARLFRHLRDTKKRKSYAGFENMVHLSSGIVRDFLEPCYLMFDACASKVSDRCSIKSIPPDTQNEILFTYSEQFLFLRPEEIRKDLPPEKVTQLEQLITLLESLGRLFYERLTDLEAREARLFSFTIRGPIPPDVQGVLDMGGRYRYFQFGSYGTKQGGGREKWFILNRRLCPVFKLDPTGFEGRFSVTPDLIRLACQDPERFVRLRLRRTETEQAEQLPLFTLEEESLE